MRDTSALYGLLRLAAMLVIVSLAMQTAQADPPDITQSHYPYFVSRVPLAQRQAEFAKRELPGFLSPVPRIDCPLYVMEYHIWWRSPFGPEGRPGYAHWNTLDDTDTAHGPAPWMRHTRLVGYPVAGLYNSMDEGIIRWQLQCMRNAGIDGVFVQLFPEWNRGEEFIADGIWRRVLTIAGEVGIKVAAHDEVMFRRGSAAQNPDVMERRAGAFIKKYGDNPAYLKIKGKPAYAFQYWEHISNKIDNQRLFEMFKTANQIAGQPVFWIPFHAPDPELYSNENVPGAVVCANSIFIKDVSEFYPSDESFNWPHLEEWLGGYHDMHVKFPDKYLGLWGYAGFNNSPETRLNGKFGWMPRRGGRTLVELLRRYVKEQPSFIQLSSWNDWEENTALEPGLRFDGYDGDPYLYCRILAAAKGKTFTPPSLPPKESVDPWLWQVLYGKKSTPPEVNADIVGSGKQIQVTSEGSSARPKSIFVLHRPDWSNDLTRSSALPDGVALSPNKPFTLQVAADALPKAERAVYAGIEYEGAARGTIEISYPAHHKTIQYDPEFDEVRGPLLATILLDGKQKSEVAIRLLRDFDFSAQPRQMTLMWRPASGQPADQLPIIKRIDLLCTLSQGKLESGWATKSNSGMERSLNLATSGRMLQGDIIYLYAQDEAGNRSAPIGVAIGNSQIRK